MFRKILVAVDGSEHARKAAEISADLARKMNSEMWLVTAYDPIPSYLGDPYLGQVIEQRVKAANQIIQEALKIIGEVPRKVHIEKLEGPAAEAILSVVDARQIDLVVMGTRGLGQLAGLLLGSQSQKVVTHAPCPVLLVR